MKGKDFISEDKIKEDDCTLCAVHTQLYEKIQCDVCICPYCNEIVSKDCRYQNVVGETNNSDLNTLNEEKFEIAETFRCEKCGKMIALSPTKVMYNANHDVFYYGGKCYMNDENFNEMIKKIKQNLYSKIESVLDNKRMTKHNRNNQILLLVEREIEQNLATTLYNLELKK